MTIKTFFIGLSCISALFWVLFITMPQAISAECRYVNITAIGNDYWRIKQCTFDASGNHVYGQYDPQIDRFTGFYNAIEAAQILTRMGQCVYIHHDVKYKAIDEKVPSSYNCVTLQGNS